MNRFFHSHHSTLKKTKSLVQLFIVQVYGWMTCGLILTSFVSWYTYHTPYLLKLIFYNNYTTISLIMIQIILVMIISNKIQYLNSKLATFLFMLYSVLTGLTLSSIIILYTYTSIFNAFISTSFMFGIMTIYGYFTKKDLRNFESLLLMSIIGILIGSIINLLMHSKFLMWIITYFNIITFTFLAAYNTQKIKYFIIQNSINNKNQLKKFSILGALNLYLNFINIFLISLRLFNNKK
ncbi:Bax inhibitor-1 family protein [Sodalis-like secondary symbiont of Drepanosiphum platanoidis]|uniref:Bax inhibitor-1/YccA family protein n=1 Tax=Sodalis-like secondary symbiont of Drepanosiphum platanoidis TaxID=2994493 RepID=UPI003464D76E